MTSSSQVPNSLVKQGANVTIKGHSKHANISRPTLGHYGRFELGVLGAPCSEIKDLVTHIANGLPHHKVTYLDADHQASDPTPYQSITDKIHYHQVSTSRLTEWDQKLLLSESDILMVNVNHFTAAHQIVCCTAKKRESLSRKLDRLTDVRLVLLGDEIAEPFDFLTDHIQGAAVMRMTDVEHIIHWVKAEYQSKLPGVKGLVLAGGRSQRMGTSKAMLQYHDQQQVYHAATQIEEAGAEAHISRRGAMEDLTDRYPMVLDTFDMLGPYGAILSAFRYDPDAAWLTIACDQPLLAVEHLDYLIQHRDPSKLATCYHNPETNFPEPLITIWEPRAYSRMLQFLAMGYSCPRKVLINSDICELRVDDVRFMRNANTPEERAAIEEVISNLKK